MSVPDLIDEQFDEIVRELRSGEVTASPELRERVRAIVEREPEPPVASGRFRLRGRRRLAFVLVPVAAIVAAAVGVGVFSPDETTHSQAGKVNQIALKAVIHGSPAGRGAYSDQGRVYSPVTRQNPHSLPIPTPASTAGGQPYSVTLPPSGSRAQLYAVDLRLRVNDL